MIKKIKTLKGIKPLNREEQRTIYAAGSRNCPFNPSQGLTGESCTSASDCTPLIIGFPVACLRNCCLSAY